MADQITVNSYDLACARAEFAASWGALDAKRPTAWTQYGYPQNLTFDDFYRAYERGGVGNGAVHRILDGCWEDVPRIKKPKADKPDQWEEGIGRVFEDLNIWGKLQDFDRRNLVGRYAGLVYRIADGQQLNEPLGKGKLVDVVPLYEGQIKVLKWNEDETSSDYGKPLMFQIETSPPADGWQEAKPRTWLKVHPSRIQILAEGSVNGDFYNGVPLLKAGFNALVDLEKISGGSGESFLKNSARTFIFEYDKDAQVQTISQNADGTPSTKTVREVHQEQARQLNRNLDSSIVMQGGKANTAQTTISDPTGAFMLAGNIFAASIRLPFTIVFGQQTGRLASDEDKSDANKRFGSRRRFVITPALKEFVSRLQACGALEAGEFEIEWPDLGAPSAGEKVDVMSKMATAMKAAFDAGLTEPLFDANELRGVVDFEPRTDDGMPTEEDRKREEEAAASAAKTQTKPAPE